MSLQIVKPKTQRGKRAIDHREPKIHENVKTCMLMKGGNTSQVITQCLKELHMLKKPHAVLLKKKNITRPFEDETSLEFFSSRADASLFAFGSSSKKRPNNLILGRFFDGHILDMVEFGVEKFVSLSDIVGPKSASGSKPALIFNGEDFEKDPDHIRIKNLLIDFFRGPVVDNIRLAGLDHAVSFTAINGKILLRNYRISTKNDVELSNMGPSLDLVLRRMKLASDDFFKRAIRQPKTLKPKKTKNVSHDAFGSKMGRIHMTRQDLTQLPNRVMKRVKKLNTSDSDPAKKQKMDD